MSRFARVEGGIIAEIIDLPDGLAPVDVFHERVAKTIQPIGEDAQPGWVFQSGKARPPEPEPLDRQAVLAAIDGAAEVARLKYITPGAGQALTYQQKAAELERYDQDTQPRIADYPLLGAEIGITADSLTGVADAVRAALASWQQAGAAIERTRLMAKADVAKAKDDDAVRAVIDAISWP